MSVELELKSHKTPPPPEVVAKVIYRGLFETGPNRLSSGMRALAIATLAVALKVWREQLLADETAKRKDAETLAAETKRELDNVRLKLAIATKELGREF